MSRSYTPSHGGGRKRGTAMIVLIAAAAVVGTPYSGSFGLAGQTNGLTVTWAVTSGILPPRSTAPSHQAQPAEAHTKYQVQNQEHSERPVVSRSS